MAGETREMTEKTSGWRGSRAVWLEAAREAFVATGLDAVKIQPLASRLNLSRTSFYWFFGDRAALLEALLEDWEATNTGSLVAAPRDHAATNTEAVQVVFLNLLKWFLASCPNGRQRNTPLDLTNLRQARSKNRRLAGRGETKARAERAAARPPLRFSTPKSAANG